MRQALLVLRSGAGRRLARLAVLCVALVAAAGLAGGAARAADPPALTELRAVVTGLHLEPALDTFFQNKVTDLERTIDALESPCPKLNALLHAVAAKAGKGIPYAGAQAMAIHLNAIAIAFSCLPPDSPKPYAEHTLLGVMSTVAGMGLSAGETASLLGKLRAALEGVIGDSASPAAFSAVAVAAGWDAALKAGGPSPAQAGAIIAGVGAAAAPLGFTDPLYGVADGEAWDFANDILGMGPPLTEGARRAMQGVLGELYDALRPLPGQPSQNPCTVIAKLRATVDFYRNRQPPLLDVIQHQKLIAHVNAMAAALRCPS